MPEISIESLDLAKAISYLGSDNDESWSRFDNYHRSALQRLEASGVDFALIASNTAQQSPVGLVCTELPLAFPKMPTLGIFEYEGILYINANVVHINAAFDFAIEPS